MTFLLAFTSEAWRALRVIVFAPCNLFVLRVSVTIHSTKKIQINFLSRELQ